LTNDGHNYDQDLGTGPNVLAVELLPAGQTHQKSLHPEQRDRGGAELVWAFVVSALPLFADVAYKASRDDLNVIKFSTLAYCLFALSATASARAVRNHKNSTAALLFSAGVLQIMLAVLTTDRDAAANMALDVLLIASTVCTVFGILIAWWPDDTPGGSQ
jgi:hypothetical protein